MVCNSNSTVAEIQEACRIGKLAMSAAMSVHKHVDWYNIGVGGHGAFFSYHCFVAPVVERLQECITGIRRGFESGIAHGDRSLGKMNPHKLWSATFYLVYLPSRAHFSVA